MKNIKKTKLPHLTKGFICTIITDLIASKLHPSLSNQDSNSLLEDITKTTNQAFWSERGPAGIFLHECKSNLN